MFSSEGRTLISTLLSFSGVGIFFEVSEIDANSTTFC